MRDEMKLTFSALSHNEAFARSVVAAFAARLNPTLEEVEDIRTAVSEAVTNAIIHGYRGKDGTVEIRCHIDGEELAVEIWDQGCGIEDTMKAREPFYTSRPDLERSGLGFTVMEAMMDTLQVHSLPGEGTGILMTKRIQRSAHAA